MALANCIAIATVLPKWVGPRNDMKKVAGVSVRPRLD